MVLAPRGLCRAKFACRVVRRATVARGANRGHARSRARCPRPV